MKRKKETKLEKETKRIKALIKDVDRPRLIGEVSRSAGFAIRKFDAVALATSLPGTGGTVKPSKQREMLIAEMRTRDVAHPEQHLDLPTSAMVKLSVLTNPGDKQGRTLDVEVECSDQCTATDLTGGYVLPARLQDIMVLDGSVRTGKEKAVASGEIVVMPVSYTRRSELEPLRGVIIGGGRLLEDRKLGIQINPEYQHVMITNMIASSLNQRFYFRDASKQQSAAEGKNDQDIVLRVVPKYRLDPDHFMSVVLSTGFGETPAQVEERIAGCAKLLRDRVTVRRAAAELEAIGTPAAANVLLNALNASSDPEIRFHCAYALSYLDSKESIPTLMELAKTQPSFRPLCLIGLCINEANSAREALDEFLQEAEPELRFGAFWAIRNRNAFDPVVTGEKIGEDLCSFVQVPSATPLIVVSLQEKKEIVLFGNSIGVAVIQPMVISRSLRIAPGPNNMVRIFKRYNNGDVENTEVTSDLPALIKGIATVNGNYSDVVQLIDQLASTNNLASPMAMNPRPQAGRVFVREDMVKPETETPETSKEESSWWMLPSLWKPKKTESDEPEPESKTKQESFFDQ